MAKAEMENLKEMLVQIQAQINNQATATQGISDKIDSLKDEIDNLSNKVTRINFYVFGDKGLKETSFVYRLGKVEKSVRVLEDWRGNIKISWAVVGTIAGIVSPLLYSMFSNFIERLFK